MKMRVRLGGFIYCGSCFVLFFFLVTIFSFSLFLSSSILEKFRLVGFDLLLFTFERKRKIEGSFVFWNKFKTQNFSLFIHQFFIFEFEKKRMFCINRN